MNHVLETLTQARELLSNPAKWSRDNHFVPNGIIGAVGGRTSSGAYQCLSALLEKKGWGSGNLSGFASSSKTTHEDLMNLFSEAITSIIDEPDKQ